MADKNEARTVEDDCGLRRRFDRVGRLVGEEGFSRLTEAHVVVAGLGGVGSFAAEALARSAVGQLTLVDFDLVCATNTNRQIEATRPTIGRPKVEALAERLRLVNPDACLRPLPLFYSAETAEEVLGRQVDFVVDAIDNLTTKAHLLATCRKRGIPVVCSTGASGRLDPTAVRVADLAETRVDPVADSVRRILRKKHGFPAEGPFGIPAVFSTEEPAKPLAFAPGERGPHCRCPSGSNPYHSAERRRLVYGTASFVTGAFGLACASVVVRALAARA
jgi:tRNA A37 threonylcarbamoyladenosine dehydratase